jgi:hypothetical protein
MCRPSPARSAGGDTPEAEDDDVIRQKLAKDEKLSKNPNENKDKEEEYYWMLQR